ncbi:MAG: helix-turn-helix domain-containing protein [Phycisphaerae bacterium]|nr:helix-turn-helix domain-containing protein [Phycisphaerae bacterium]
MDALTLSVQPLLLCAANAARVLGIGERHFHGLHSSGRLGPLPVRLGRRTLWSRIELEEWVKRDRSSVDSPTRRVL